MGIVRNRSPQPPLFPESDELGGYSPKSDANAPKNLLKLTFFYLN
jgi:hypothetical protein